MPIYQPPLLTIDPKETRRYAGLMKAKDFSEDLILEACQDARLLAEPKGIWELYDYDCQSQRVEASPPFIIEGQKIGRHLSGCDKVILLSATVGETIENEVTQRFQNGRYKRLIRSLANARGLLIQRQLNIRNTCLIYSNLNNNFSHAHSLRGISTGGIGLLSKRSSRAKHKAQREKQGDSLRLHHFSHFLSVEQNQSSLYQSTTAKNDN